MRPRRDRLTGQEKRDEGKDHLPASQMPITGGAHHSTRCKLIDRGEFGRAVAGWVCHGGSRVVYTFSSALGPPSLQGPPFERGGEFGVGTR